MRNTKQREVMIEELRKLRTHPSADELYAIVKKRLPRISLGTVYRNLEVLSREGIIHRLEVAGSHMRFDGELGEHQHIRCARCGRVDDLVLGSRLNACDKNVAKRTGYRMLERRVEFVGICPACRKRERDS
ncbi:MAG TPA: transcriptional repressor [Candidatus Bathyarchaeia archaeon]|nr:transcriptional repressor [Candidatus Bathyarchaeia archaeon]